MCYIGTTRPCTFWGLILLLLVTVLLIAATGTPEFLTGGTGAFQVCSGGDASNSNCYSIDNDCKVKGQLVGLSCSKFNAFRAFLLIGLLTSCITTVIAILAFCSHRVNNVGFLFMTLIFSAITWLSLLISFAVFVSWTKDNNNAPKGDSFGLLVTAWVFTPIAACLWAMGCNREVDDGAPLLPAALAGTGEGGAFMNRFAVKQTAAGGGAAAPGVINVASSQPYPYTNNMEPGLQQPQQAQQPQYGQQQAYMQPQPQPVMQQQNYQTGGNANTTAM